MGMPFINHNNKMGKLQLFILLLFCCANSMGNLRFSIKWFSATPATESSVEVTTRRYNDSLTLHGPIYFSSLQEQKIGKEKKKKYEQAIPKKKNDLLTNVRMILGRVPFIKRTLGMECWQEIGCFSAVAFNDIINGYIAMLPMGPEEIDPTFYLQSTSEEPRAFKHNFDEDEMRNSSFDPELITVIITHGYYKGIEEWMIKVVENLKRYPDDEFNYILMDWSKGSKVMNYALAAANTQVVGALTAYFIDRLCNTYTVEGLTREMFHLIGHSLGAHTMGFAGKRMKNPKVSRIIGLDPAGPGFRDKKAEHRIDYSDASQVVVIHTDMSEFATKGLGIYESIGDIDFYPNGGKHQPGCPPSQPFENLMKVVFTGSNEDFSCSHNRAPVILYTPDNIDDICLPVGYYCEDWETFLEGRCASCQTFNQLKRCQLLGLFPYYWENIAFHFSNDSDYINNQPILIKIKAQVGGEYRLLAFERRLSQSFRGNIHTLLVTFNFIITRISKMGIEWLKSDDMPFVDTKIIIPFVEINYMSHYSAKIRNDFSVVLCPKKDGVIRPEAKINFVKCKNQIRPDVSALRMSSTNLSPFTDRADIVNTDFDNQEIVSHKMTIVPRNRWFSYFSKPDDPKDEELVQ